MDVDASWDSYALVLHPFYSHLSFCKGAPINQRWRMALLEREEKKRNFQKLLCLRVAADCSHHRFTKREKQELQERATVFLNF